MVRVKDGSDGGSEDLIYGEEGNWYRTRVIVLKGTSGVVMTICVLMTVMYSVGTVEVELDVSPPSSLFPSSPPTPLQ